MDRYKVLHVGLGPIGLSIFRALASRPEVEVVGAIDPAPDKAGTDLGALAGRPPIGIVVNDRLAPSELRKRPDIAIHSTGSRLQMVAPQLHQLLEAGMNVISTCEEVAWPWLQYADIANRLDDVATKHDVSLLGTGVNPGFVMDVLPVVLSSMTTRIDRIEVLRTVDASQRRGPLQVKIGSGLSPSEFTKRVNEKTLGHVGLKESVAMLAAGVGWVLEEVREEIRPVVSETAVRTETVQVLPGQVMGLHQKAVGLVSGKVVVHLELEISLQPKEARDAIQLVGDPTFTCIIPGGISGDVATVAAVVHALPKVIQGRPGLLTMLDLTPAASPNAA